LKNGCYQTTLKTWWERNGVTRKFFSSNSYSLDIWHGCLQSIRKILRGWNLKNLGEQRKEKLELTKGVEEIDLIAETRLLSMEEWEERIALEKKTGGFM
jgi:hypothetical protein